MSRRLLLSLLFFMSVFLAPVGAQGICSFDQESLQFAGSKVEQARCLLSPVGRYARVDGPLTELPPTLQRLLESDLEISPDQLRAYLEQIRVEEEQVGGSLYDPLARAESNNPLAPQARYLVIHDTSWPYLRNDPFPSDLNTSEFVNTFNYYVRRTGSEVAHAFVNRRGEIFNQLDFSVPWRATRFESREIGTRSRGLFLHVELVQPRRRHPRGGSRNDALAPSPGFTEEQYKWLALLYVSASVRRGDWLIPSYHAVLDHHIRGGHDDPQNFDLSAFDSELGNVISSIEALSTADAPEIVEHDPEFEGDPRAIFLLAPSCIQHGDVCPVDIDYSDVIVLPRGGVISYPKEDGEHIYIESLAVPYTASYLFQIHERVTGTLFASFYSPSEGGGANCGPVYAEVDDGPKITLSETEVNVEGGEDVRVSVDCNPEFKSWGDAQFDIGVNLPW